jgi:class 3 adenylate cyclase
MNKKGAMNWLKNTFARARKRETSRTGLLFGFLCAVVSLILIAGGFLTPFNDYLNAFVFQYSYSEPELQHQVMIVKKDQATSELIGKNPGREEFASLFELLGNTQKIKRKNRARPSNFTFLSIKLGFYPGLRLPIIQNSMVDWSGYTRSVDDLFYNNPQLPGLFSLIKIDSRMFSPLTSNFFKTLAGGRGKFILPSLGLFEKDGEPQLIDISETSAKHIADEGDDPVSAEEYEKRLEEAEELFDRWENLLLNILNAKFDMRFYYFPETGPDVPENSTTALQIDFVSRLKGVPAQYEVGPASVIAFDFILQGQKAISSDNALENAIEKSKAKVVLAAHTKTEEEYAIDSSAYNLATGATKLARFQKKQMVTRLIKPANKFVKPGVKLGMIDVAAGNKSYVTEVPLFLNIPSEKRLEPSFSLLTAMLALDQAPDGVASESYVDAMYAEFSRIYPEVAAGKFRGPLKIIDRTIPVNAHGRMYLKYVGSTQKNNFKRAAIPSVSFYECFSEDLLEKFKSDAPVKIKSRLERAHGRTLSYGLNKAGKICMAGPFEVSDFDFYPTPLSMRTPYTVQNQPLMGVEIHANAVLNILNQTHLRHPDMRQTIFVLLITALLLGLILDLISPLIGAVVTFVFMAGISSYASYSYNHLGQVFNFSSMLISYPSIWCLATLTNYLRQRARAKSTKDMFSRFVAADVVQYMLDNPELVKPGGQKVELSIFFSDVAGFTSISEALTPEELVVLLNEYLGAMTDLLFEYGGTLDKFIGDAVMAFWNYPKEQHDHAVRACLCALAMQDKINELQIGWAKRGLPKVSARAGVNSADVVVGYMGSVKAQMNFTCMGDGVNLASRLEGANKEYGTALMVSDATYQKAKHRVTGRFLDFLAVKGKKEPVKVFELVSEKGKEPPDWNELSEMYDHAIQLHLDRKWDEAIATFEAILERWPEDGPSATYIKRCQEYKIHPPPENWDGRYILTHK